MSAHDADYLGFDHGAYDAPPAITAPALSLPDIRDRAGELRAELDEHAPLPSSEEWLRARALDQMLEALATRAEILLGEPPASFDEETRRLYGVSLPRRDEAEFEAALEELDRLLPGSGSVSDRLVDLEDCATLVPESELQRVFELALDECRDRTRRFLTLPATESITVELVHGEPFAARSTYEGGGRSRLRVNADVPMTFETIVHLASHEGYPGHHVQALLRDRHLFQDKGWPEYGFVPLFSASALVSEGAARYGVELAFPGNELREFVEETLLPVSGVERDPWATAAENASAVDLARVDELLTFLDGAGEEAARRYLNGELDRAGALGWIQRYLAIETPEIQEAYLDSIESYRSHVIYSGHGKELVRRLVEREPAAEPAVLWRRWAELFTRPFAHDVRSNVD